MLNILTVFKSTTFQFAFMVLVASAVAAFMGQLEWVKWLDEAVVLVGIYASKEGIKYGATAYTEANKQ